MYRIIVVEDKQITREGLRRCIDWKSLNAEVVGTFESGMLAIEYLNRNKVDIVITDIEMDNGTGIELAEFIYLKFPNIKVLIITAFENFKYAKKSLELGVFAYILKPIKQQEVIEKTRDAIEVINKESEKLELINHLTLQEIEKILQEYLAGASSQIQRLKSVFNGSEGGTQYYLAISIKSRDNTHISAKECKEIFSQYISQVFTIRLNGFLSCIIILESLSQIEGHIFESIYSRLYQNSRVCIGKTVTRIEDLQESLKTSYLVYNIAFLNNLKGILKYDEINKIEMQKKYLKNNVYMEFSYLKDLIFKDKNNEYMMYIKEVFETYKKNNIEPMYIYNQCIDVLKYLYTVLNQSFSYKESKEIEYSQIYEFSNLNEIEDFFVQEIIKVHNQLNTFKKNRVRPIVKLALEYSIENIEDTSLNLKAIAEQLNISYAYLSKAFKEDFNTSYTEYMNLYKIELAKKRLLGTNAKIYEICEEIGLETKNFHYLFKKYEGITPKEFQANNS